MSGTKIDKANPFCKARVFVVDDHKMFSAGLARLIGGEPDLIVSGSAVDGESAMQSLTREHFDVVLTDLSVPGLSGLDLIRSIREQHPQLPILVLTMHTSAQLAQAVIQAGASGFITKSADPEQLFLALRTVLRGGRFMEPCLMEMIAFSFEKTTTHLLSSRQKEILSLLATGMSNKEIAATLHISEKTVSTHRVRLGSKLGAHSRVDLIRYATSSGALLPSQALILNTSPKHSAP